MTTKAFLFYCIMCSGQFIIIFKLNIKVALSCKQYIIINELNSICPLQKFVCKRETIDCMDGILQDLSHDILGWKR